MFYLAGNFVERNFKTWSKQYEASKTEEVVTMNKLMAWLQERMPHHKMELENAPIRTLETLFGLY